MTIKLGSVQHLPPGAPALKPHPFADLFPMMSDAEYAAHLADIKQNGINHPIILHRGMLLDGRNRYKAATELGIGIATQVFAGSDREALDLVASENIHRRHLNTQQRAMIAAKMAEIRLGGNQHTAKPAPIGAPALPLAQPTRPAKPTRTSWPAGHVITMTREYPGDGNEPMSVGTCECGAVFRFPVSDKGVQMDAACEAHWCEFDGKPIKSDLPPTDVREFVERVQAPSPIEPPKPLMSQTEAAELMNVSRRSVQRAAVVAQKGAPELVEAVTAGKVATEAAAEIAQLPIEEQKRIIASADPKAVKDVAKANRTAKREQSRERKLEQMRAPQAAPLLTGNKFGVIYVDIPRDWKAWSAQTGMEKSPENHYATAPLDALIDLPVRELAADNCALLMYAWQPSLIDQIELMAEWGFCRLRPRDAQGRLVRENGKALAPVGEGDYRSHMVWAKRSTSGNWHRGTGFWWINAHELLLLGVKGDVPCPLEGQQDLSILDTVVGEHSAKPDAVRAMIDRYFPGVPKIELFARVFDDAGNRLLDESRWPDWRFWGNQAVPPEPQDQISQDEAHYRAIPGFNPGTPGGYRHCGACKNRISEHECRRVSGAIGAGMTCNKWAPIETVIYAAGPAMEAAE
ncbi:MAG TPA: MT-A70 family methyltransferase [Xanthobacteraceae bacterium]|nr:MT-A70 family methyltransferase [Xanthobacteraceae bacterium]